MIDNNMVKAKKNKKEKQWSTNNTRNTIPLKLGMESRNVGSSIRPGTVKRSIRKLMEFTQTTYKHYKTIVSKYEHNNVYAEIKADITAQK